MPRHENLSVSLINLDRDNPRIKNYLDNYTSEEIASAHIALALSNSSNTQDATTSYTSLRDSIKKCGGIIHPIIVSLEEDSTYVAIEGNTRLQIYKEFQKTDKSGTWDYIPAIVYDHLENEKKHEIRLQSHLVGPRAWDPYSKAKYLWQLSEVEHMPLNTIISLCGGGKTDIQRSIAAYQYMEIFYRPYVKSKRNRRFDIREFSKFHEFQNNAVQHSIRKAGFDLSIFAEWVAEGNIDTAQRVRILPKVLANDEAKAKFLRTNLGEAEKIIFAAELDSADLSKYPYYVLVSQLYKKLISSDPSISEIRRLATEEAAETQERIYHLQSLAGQLSIILENIENIQNG